MRTVYNNFNDVIHLFAQQTQPHAKSSNVFFYNDKIYSYGYHYLLASFIENNKKGQKAILIDDSGYSRTTGKHISTMIQASRQYKQFYKTHTDKKILLNTLEDIKKKIIKAKKPFLYSDQAQHLEKKYLEFCEFTGQKIDKDLKKAFLFFHNKTEEMATIYAKEIEKAEKARIKAEKARIKVEKIKDAENLDKFMNYDINYCRFYCGEDFIRISQDGQFIETSQNVKIPIESAKNLYKMIQIGKDIRGYKIEDFTVISLNGVLQIGCHHINTKNTHEIGQTIISEN